MSLTADNYLSQNNRKVAPFLILSLLAHLVIFTLLIKIIPEVTKLQDEVPVELIELPEEKSPPTAPPDSRRRRIVEAPADTPQQVPRQADYLSDRNSAVEQEMHRYGDNAAVASAAGAAAAAAAADIADEQQDRPADSDFNLRTTSEGIMPERLEGDSARRMAALMPSEQALARVASGDSGTPDYLPQTREGFQTRLNTVYFEHASFINRMKTAIKGRWHPLNAYRRVDPTGSRIARTRYSTSVVIKLTADGSLADVSLFEESGIEIFDEAFINAIRAAAPFPHPPSKLVEDDGHIYLPFVGVILLERPGFNFNVVGPSSNRHP